MFKYKSNEEEDWYKPLAAFAGMLFKKYPQVRLQLRIMLSKDGPSIHLFLSFSRCRLPVSDALEMSSRISHTEVYLTPLANFPTYVSCCTGGLPTLDRVR